MRSKNLWAFSLSLDKNSDWFRSCHEIEFTMSLPWTHIHARGSFRQIAASSWMPMALMDRWWATVSNQQFLIVQTLSLMVVESKCCRTDFYPGLHQQGEPEMATQATPNASKHKIPLKTVVAPAMKQHFCLITIAFFFLFFRFFFFIKGTLLL